MLLGIRKVRKLDLHAGDRVLVHLNRKPTPEEKRRLVAQLEDALDMEVHVIVVPPGVELEVQR